MAREGLEPSKPLGRQIYSLLRLTASLPRQLSVVNVVSSVPRRTAAVDGAGEGIRTPDLLITNQLLYQAELRQPDKREILAHPVPAVQAIAYSDYSRAGPRFRNLLLYTRGSSLPNGRFPPVLRGSDRPGAA